MVTHQQLTGGTDDELVERMVRSYAGRYNDGFWALFDEQVRPRLSAQPTIVDLGCGPGLLVQGFSKHAPEPTLHGLDLTPAMIEYAKGLDYGGATPNLGVLNLLTDPLPLADGSVDVASIGAVLHLFDDPFAVLDKIRRTLKPGGTFLVYDWVRTPLEVYTARDGSTDQSPEVIRGRAMKLFAVHNRYTSDDWRWVLGQAGFDVLSESAPGGKYHRLFVAVPKGSK